MGHREDLLEGARRCLLEKGYARTTARDVVKASGTNLGSIGYHYGSFEALLNAAMHAAIEEWGEQMGQVLGEARAKAQSQDELVQLIWDRLIATFPENRALWLVTIEALLVAERNPEIKQGVIEGQREGRRGLAALLLGVPEEEVPPHLMRTLGSIQLALFSGVIVQWLSDPSAAPTSQEVVAGLREMAKLLAPAEPAAPPRKKKPTPPTP
jgi:AcrR family transcriptional regulator